MNTRARRADAVQAMPAPTYLAEYRHLLTEGSLVDRAGRPVSGAPCATCDGLVDTLTCPGSLPCLRCGATVGRRRKRPSGHTADRWHADRARDARQRDDARERAGDLSLLAPWPCIA